jgi:hypothetical protein
MKPPPRQGPWLNRDVRSRRIRFAATVAVLSCGAAVLYRFDPSARGRANFYPTCVIHQYTGLYCPACGATRAIHALLHGHFLAATHFNPLVTLLAVPVLGWSFIRSGISAVLPHVQYDECRNVRLSRMIGALVITFSIVRNIPCRPFNYLAPPESRHDTTAIRSAAATGIGGNWRSIGPCSATAPDSPAVEGR